MAVRRAERYFVFSSVVGVSALGRGWEKEWVVVGEVYIAVSLVVEGEGLAVDWEGGEVEEGAMVESREIG